MDKISAQQVVNLYLLPLKVSSTFTLGQWASIVLILRNQQLLACYSLRLRNTNVFDVLPSQIQRHFLNAEVLANNHKSQVEFEAQELNDMLINTQQYLIFLKGAGYTLSDSAVGNGRVYNDVDLLVDKASIDKVEKKLALIGWISEEITEHDDKYYRKWAHEIPPMRHGKRGTIVDIHHNIVPIISGRHIDAEIFAKQIVINKNGLQILSFPAMTLHSLIHLFFNEDVNKGYRDLLDIHTLINKHGTDDYWQVLLDLAKETGFELELFLTCRYTQQILHTEIPEHVITAVAVCKPWNIGYLDFIYQRLLLPNHPVCRSKGFAIAEFLLLLRGHFQKMPPHILAYHLVTKCFVNMTKALLGKHFFTKELDQP